MGFMAGFGKAFSSSFENSAQRRAVRERDAFQVAYEEYSRRRAEYDQDKKAWDSALTKSEAVAARYGVPKEAVPKIAEWYKAGYSDAYVDELVAGTKFSSTPSVTQASDTNNVDAQMQNNGFTYAGADAPVEPTPSPANPNPLADPAQEQPTNEVQQAAPVQENTDILGNMMGPDGIFKNAGESDQQQAERSVMESTGVPQEEYDQVMGGYQPPVDPNAANVTMEPITSTTHPLAGWGMDDGITDAKLKAARVKAREMAKSPDPKDREEAAKFEEMLPFIEGLSADETDTEDQTAYIEAIKPIQTSLTELRNERAAAKTFNDQAMELAEMVAATDGAVLTSASGITVGVEEVFTEVQQGLDILGGYADQLTGGTFTENEALNAVMTEVAKADQASGNAETARVKREVTAKVIRMVFALGRANGVEGNGFSNQDYQNFLKALQAGNSMPAFMNNLKRLGSEVLANVDNQANELKSDPFALAAMNTDMGNKVLTNFLAPTSERPDFANITKWVGTPDIDSSGAPLDPNTGKKPKSGPFQVDESTTFQVPYAADEGHKIGEVRVDREGIRWRYIGGAWGDKNNWERVGSGK